MSNRCFRSLLIAAGSCAVAAGAWAQPCTPTWDRTIGTPGASTGYVGAFGFWQGDLLLSGSFPQIDGVSGTQYAARYNRTTDTFSPYGGGLGSGISNAFGTSFATYNNDLYIGGFFADAAGTPDTKSVVRWDGTNFSSLGTGWAFDSVNSVWALLSSSAINNQNRLYIAGGFETITGQPAGSIASWDGTTLTPIASSIVLVGINPLITQLIVYNDGTGDQLYAGGRFSSIDGVAANMIARWNGTTWSPVGTNLTPRLATGEVNAMTVFDDGTGPALYVGGFNFRVDGVNYSVAKWNGTTWSPVGQNLAGRVWTLTPFDDGTGVKLYGGGTQATFGYLYRLENNVWTSLNAGIDASVFKLQVDGDRMYVGGSFNNVAGLPTGKVATLVACPGVTCGTADFNGDGDVGTDADIEAFFACLAGNCCTTCFGADFNDDGDVGTDADIEAFFRVLAGGNC